MTYLTSLLTYFYYWCKAQFLAYPAVGSRSPRSSNNSTAGYSRNALASGGMKDAQLYWWTDASKPKGSRSLVRSTSSDLADALVDAKVLKERRYWMGTKLVSGEQLSCVGFKLVG